MSKNEFINEVKSNQVICGIYKIENLINHKVYIGQSNNIYRRWKEHIKLCKDNKYGLLYNSMRKYGIENFSFEVIKETKDLDYWEIFLIQLFKSTDRNYGYNVSDGGFVRSKNEIRNLLYIKCIETGVICTAKEWNELGYSSVYDVILGRMEIHKGYHFIKSKKNEHDEFLQSEDYEFKKLSMKQNKRENIIYAKCIETDEIYNCSEWKKLGYTFVDNVIEGSAKSCKSKHFIKSTKEEYYKFKENPHKSNNLYIEDVIYAKCIETNDILSAKEWIELGYNEIYPLLKNKRLSCKGRHFVISDKNEYISFINNHKNKQEILERNKPIERESLYVKCAETNEIKTASEWYSLGYDMIYKVLKGKFKSTKGLHFVKSTKLEFEKYKNCNNDNELINKRENMVKDVIYVKCIETNDILSASEWIKLGYTNIKNAYKSTKLYKNKHFIKVSRDEYLEYLKNNFDKSEVLKRNHDTKPKEIIYAKCVETSEIYSSTEWRRLGYKHVKLIINEERNVEKGKHFIKSTKEEYESYLKQLSSKSA